MAKNKGRVSKKAKTVDLDELAFKAWQHYRDYLDSCDNEDGNEEDDTNELVEIMELLSPHVSKLSNDVDVKDLRTIKSLLPVLLSVVSYILADLAISLFLQLKKISEDGGAVVMSGGDGGDDEEFNATTALKEAQQHLENATSYFPLNAAAWSMGANFGRMTHRLSLQQITAWYQQAATQAGQIRMDALALLEDKKVDDDVKDLIEMLLLTQVAGVDLDDPSDGSDDEDEEGDEGGIMSASTVESTSRFTAAMLLSTTGDHDRALEHLKEFPLTDRLHPKVWMGKATPIKSGTVATTDDGSAAPVSFQRPNGLLPSNLYEGLCKVFEPGAAYWKESDYDNNGYYSFFMDRPPPGQAPANLLEEVMVDHLLPLATKQLGEETASSICGYEWWVHTRPIQANLGHNLHFDTDEAILSQEGKITHPILSSVLYLTGGDHGGATIVLDQTPDCETNAEQCWRSVPKDNSFLGFPGNLLHGVLPCPGKNPTSAATVPGSEPVVASDLWKDPPSSSSSPSAVPHRLTLMVGFWTRRVPDKMKQQRLYGPCGPMPPCTDEHTWVQEISRGYKKSSKKTKTASAAKDNDDIKVVPIPRVTPAWEKFQSNASLHDQPLMIPRAMDHRFFVHSGSMCFRESLFERDELDDHDDEDDEEEEDDEE
jgi:hypothetical protein